MRTRRSPRPLFFSRFVTQQLLSADQRRLGVIDAVPAGGGLQFSIDVVDVLHAFGLQPLAESGGALLGIHGDAVFQVARPQSTPLNLTPDSPASSSVSLNSALLTPAER